jgi:TonB-linked SusC/RagA family outer membrane protein
MKQIYSRCLSVLLLTLLTMNAYAQKNVSGTVKDASGTPIPAVSILVKGTKIGASTDANGRFSIAVNEGQTLVFRFLGYKPQEVVIGTSATLNIMLQEDDTSLNEVVVTALGIKREKKALGYALQEVKGESLVEAREPNLVNTLSGKVAGLQVTRSGNGPAGSSRINLRGSNSLTGDNQPLIVVDGVPVSNFTGAINSEGKQNNDFYNPATDMGNGLSDINPEDIESVTVLKGPTASALYGSRAGNGVILVTTKSGKAQKGLGITVSSTLGIESVFAQGKLQNDYGQGTEGVFDKISSLSWGPKIEGQKVTDWTGKEVTMAAYDNIANYIQNGISSNQSVTFQQQINATSIYTSFNRLDDKSLIPGAKLKRTNLLARAVSKFGKDERWTTDTKIQYTNNSGSNDGNTFRTIYLLPRSLDIRGFNPSTDADEKMIWYNNSNTVNPYWGKDYNLNQDIRDRFLMNGSLKYNFNSWLNAEIKAGADKYSTTTETKRYAGSPDPATGSYSLGKRTFTEKDNLFGRLGGGFSVGGNLMSQENSGITNTVGKLYVPNLFNIKNGVDPTALVQVFNEKKINSLYGTLQVNWDGYLFLDGTLRNDWTSALITSNRSYFYPSVSLSYVLSEMISKTGQLPSWLSYAKLRVSAASVGNDLKAYELYNTYTIDKDANGNITASRGDILFDPNVKNELIKSYEAGLEARFFKSRVGIDLAIYKSNATNQLINLPMDPLSGYKYKKINSGDIQNTGIELMVDGKVFDNPDGFNWNMMLNYSHNNNTVKSIYTNTPQYSLGGFDDITVFAVENAKYGEIYGSTFKRVEDPSSPFNGQLLLNEDGLPQVGKQNTRLGNQQATSLLGITNSFVYKGFNLSFLVDGRFGGKIFSASNAIMQRNGTGAVTVVNGSRDVIADGVILNTATNAYEKNTKTVSSQRYWAAVAGPGNLGITEANLYDSSNIRLRNISLSYNLSPKFLSKTPIQRAKIGVSCNNVWLITSHLNGIDPESVFSTGENATGFENASAPTTRTVSFNLTLGF